MLQKIALITLLVRDYDEAIDFYVGKLGFKLVEDSKLTDSKRWVKVSPTESSETCLLLAKAVTDEQKKQIGNQTGGRVFLFLNTDNFQEDYKKMKLNGIHFIEEPRSENYGSVAVFEDIYGNKWDLIQEKGR